MSEENYYEIIVEHPYFAQIIWRPFPGSGWPIKFVHFSPAMHCFKSQESFESEEKNTDFEDLKPGYYKMYFSHYEEIWVDPKWLFGGMWQWSEYNFINCRFELLKEKT